MARRRLTAAERRWLAISIQIREKMGDDFADQTEKACSELIEQAFNLGKNYAEKP
jgi:hypothetical protein